MISILRPWQMPLFIIAGWINRHQQDVVEYLRTENAVLKGKLGKKRILLSDDQRRRLAVKGRILSRKALEEIATIVTPATILRWHRELGPGNGITAIAAGNSGVRHCQSKPLNWFYGSLAKISLGAD